MNTKRLSLRNQKYGYDISLLFVTIFLCIFGLIMVYSASSYTATVKGYGASYYLNKQLVSDLIGLAVLIFMSVLPYRFISWGWVIVPAYFVSLGLMIYTTYYGHTAGGKTRWLDFGFISFQTVEIVKLALILMLAWLVVNNARKISWDSENKLMQLCLKFRNSKFWLPFVLLLTTLIPVYFVKKNDLSSSIVVLMIPAILILILNNSKAIRILAIIVAVVVFGIALFIKLGDFDSVKAFCEFCTDIGILEEYQCKRIYACNDPYFDPQGAGYQVLQGLYAIGSGGLFGKGLGKSTQKLGFLPEASNDMVFNIVCEEMGLFGAFSLILLYLFLLYRMLKIATHSEDAFGSLLTIGVMTHVAFQLIFHIAAVTNVIPNTGISLPFISYGGTSSIFLMAEIGLVINVGRGRREKKQP